MISRPPYYKGKGFSPFPVARFGIPKEADSRLNKDVIGTRIHDEYWKEQVYYCVNGYQTGGIWIPGRMYFYGNFCPMNTINGNIMPDFVDVHLELALEIEDAIACGQNILIAKRRRIGASEAFKAMIIDHPYRFSPDKKQIGIAAGLEKYINDFMVKWEYAESQLPPEFYLGRLLGQADDTIVAGWTEKNSLNAWEDKGTKSTIYCRTMHNDVNGFKGLFLNIVAVEEIGEFPKFMEFYAATKDCLMSNQKQIGIMCAWGTSGDVNKGSKAFKAAWQRDFEKDWCKANNFRRLLLDGRRFYYYGGASLVQQQLPPESELLKQYKPYQLIGVEDLQLSEKNILKLRAEYLSVGNMKDYNDILKNNPLSEQELFRKSSVNNFDIGKLNDQDAKISELTHPKYIKYKLEWARDDKGMIKMPLRVIPKALNHVEDQSKCIWILTDELPRKGYQHLYNAGIDSYDQNTAKASKSLGAMCIRIRANRINNSMSSAPVAVICCRPARKEEFYELCLKAAVFYDLVGNVLVDIANGLIVQYFKDNGGWKYLADRPTRFESENSEQTHEKGVRLTGYSKPRMVGLMQTDIDDNCDKIWFPELINQLGNYDEVEIGSDNDLADAYGLSLMQDVSCEVKPRDLNDDSDDDRFKLPRHVAPDADGRVANNNRVRVDNPQIDGETFGLLFGDKS